MANPDLAFGALDKPVKGSARAERVKSRIAIEEREERKKTAVRKRDGYHCRVPHCDCMKRRDRLEVAHLDDKGMGGDHGVRTETALLILLCLLHHQGRPSLHSKDLRVEPLTAEGADGPCEFWVRDGGGWVSIGRERYVGVLEHD